MEMIGSMIKYPFAVEIFVDLASSLKPPDPGPPYSAEELVDVLLETVIRAALRAAPASKDFARCRGQMAALDAQGVCRCLVAGTQNRELRGEARKPPFESWKLDVEISGDAVCRV